MANVDFSAEIRDFKTAALGEDVRDSLVAIAEKLEDTANDTLVTADTQMKVVGENSSSTIWGDSTKHDVEVNDIQAEVNAIKAAVGSPLVVSTKAAMTDHDKVYVYVGYETGMTNGNWYYYNGTDFVSGGVYQSQGLETDKTLSVENMAADAKYTGDAVNGLKSALHEELTVMAGVNLYDGVTVTPGYYIDTDGSIKVNVRSSYSDIIAVTPEQTYGFSFLLVPTSLSGIIRIHGYSNGTWAQMLLDKYFDKSATGLYTYTLEIPVSINGIRVTLGNREQFAYVAFRAFDKNGFVITDYMQSMIDAVKYTSMMTCYTQGINTISQLAKVTGGTGSADDFLPNSVINVMAKAGIPTNGAIVGGTGLGTYLTYHFHGGAYTVSGRLTWTGKTQVFINGYGMAFRYCGYTASKDAWSDWSIIKSEETYYVGSSRDHSSLMGLFLELADDTNEKTIYVDPGEYDIYQELRDLQDAGLLDAIPADAHPNDFSNWSVFVPDNTRLVGLGVVNLRFQPLSSDESDDGITAYEAQIWSPINVRGSIEMENFNVFCDNGRYAIHDEGLNNSKYRGTRHVYRNVRCVRMQQYVDPDHPSTDGYIWTRNAVMGFGLSDSATYEFDNCYFYTEQRRTITRSFGCHDGGVSTDGRSAYTAPRLVFRNCTFLSPGNYNTHPYCVSLQTQGTTLQQRIAADFISCYFDKEIHLVRAYDASLQAYDVTLLNSGNPVIRIDDGQTGKENPFEPKIYPPVESV